MIIFFLIALSSPILKTREPTTKLESNFITRISTHITIDSAACSGKVFQRVTFDVSKPGTNAVRKLISLEGTGSTISNINVSSFDVTLLSVKPIFSCEQSQPNSTACLEATFSPQENKNTITVDFEFVLADFLRVREKPFDTKNKEDVAIFIENNLSGLTQKYEMTISMDYNLDDVHPYPEKFLEVAC